MKSQNSLPNLASNQKSITEWQKEVHSLAREKGWYDGAKRTPLEMHMLMVSEIAEATECARKGRPEIFSLGDGKPEGELIELADLVIRVFDYCEYQGWNLEKAIEMKHEFNRSRSYRHGGKKY